MKNKVKKIVFLFSFSCLILLINVFKVNASDDYYIIDDESSIIDDITEIGLTPSDYIIDKNKTLDKWFLIAIGENLNDDTKEITNYFYLYNPYPSYSNYTFDLKISLNSVNYDVVLDYESKLAMSGISAEFIGNSYFDNNNSHIIKLKANLDVYKNTNSRQYECSSIRAYNSDNDLIEYKSNFKLSCVDTIENGVSYTDMNYNSMLLITDDFVCSVILKEKYESWWQGFKELFSDNNSRPELAFYNFTSNKDIDEIIDVNISFCRKKYSYSEFNPAAPLVKPLLSLDKTEIINDRLISQNVYSYEWNNKVANFEYFKVPSSDRFIDNEFGDYVGNVSKENFDYQCSVLFDVNSVKVANGNLQSYYGYSKVLMSEITFKTNGKIYHAYVIDEDGGDDTGNTPFIPAVPSPSISILDKFKKVGKIVIFCLCSIVLLLLVSLILKPIKFIINLIRGK